MICCLPSAQITRLYAYKGWFSNIYLSVFIIKYAVRYWYSSYAIHQLRISVHYLHFKLYPLQTGPKNSRQDKLQTGQKSERTKITHDLNQTGQSVDRTYSRQDNQQTGKAQALHICCFIVTHKINGKITNNFKKMTFSLLFKCYHSLKSS